MIQNSVKTSLKGLIGLRQSTIDDMPTIDSDNLATSSGMYFQDFNSLVTVQNIYDCQENNDITDEEFNTLFENLKTAAIWKVLSAVFTDYDFVENKVLYPFENVWTNTIDNDTSFVGYEIDVAKRKDFAWRLNNIFTAFDSSDTVKILLFHSSKKSPIQSKEISVEELNEVDTSLDWNLSQFDYSGGKYYVGYLRSGLTAKAINREWDKANVQQKFCTLKMTPISVSGWDSETLFDVEDISYESETYGLNFDITAWKDFSNVIVRNKEKFVNAIGYQLSADVLNLILKATRSNRIERINEGVVLFELEGLINSDLPRTVGIMQKLSSEIKSLKENFVNEPMLRRSTIG